MEYLRHALGFKYRDVGVGNDATYDDLDVLRIGGLQQVDHLGHDGHVRS